MKFLKSYLMGTGAVVLAGLLLTLVAPRAAHAIAATAVLVQNTSSNPAIVSSMDDPGRIAYQSVAAFAGPGTCPNSEGCQVTFGPVRANHRLVVQHLSASVVFSAAPGQFGLEYFPASSGASGGLSAAPAASAVPGLSQYRGAREVPVQFYLDSGQSFEANLLYQGSAYLGGSVTASGYMLDCSAAPCSAIAH